MIPNRQTEEKRQHSTTRIPYSCYECRIPDSFPNIPMHWHSEFEIGYILSGKGEFICGDDRVTVTEGDLLILPPNMLHAAYPVPDNNLYLDAFVFHPAMLGALNNDRCTTECIRPLINGSMKLEPHISPDMPDYRNIKASADLIYSCAHNNLSQSDLLLKSELLRLFWLLEQGDNIICRKKNEVSYSEIIRPALEYMGKNFQENITIEQLAALTSLSQSYFMSCFKKAVGVSAIDHLRQLRINAACEALTDTKRSIAEIAFHCGYNNLSNFNRQFKNTLGCSPHEFRQQNGRL